MMIYPTKKISSLANLIMLISVQHSAFASNNKSNNYLEESKSLTKQVKSMPYDEAIQSRVEVNTNKRKIQSIQLTSPNLQL